MKHRLKKRRSRRNVLSVSLFPFLAVLICTLGVLIVMLVMAAKSADVDAEQRQTADDETHLKRIDELQETADVQLATIEGLEMVRPEALSRLSDSRSNRSYLEEQIRDLKSEYERVGEELLDLDRQSKLPPEEVTKSENIDKSLLEDLRQQIESAKSKLAEQRSVVKEPGPSKYQIVPHKGSGGTFRRPIFMECTRDAITLQPSGIRLLKSEFVPPLEPGNMIDSALLAIREYWKRYDLAGKEGNPYPLIVVRPGGEQTFVLARRAMKSWDDEFGYELVEIGTPLEFGEPDPQLKEEINKVVAEARNRQRNRILRSSVARSGRIGTSSRFSGRNSRPGLMASGAGGGFVANAANFDEPRGEGQSRVAQTSAQSGLRDGMPEDNSFGANSDSPNSDSLNSDSLNSNFDSSDSNQASSSNQFGENQFNQTNTATSQQRSSSASGNPNSNASGGQGGESKLQNPYADQSLAQERGSNWALPTQTQGATGYLRPIRIVCHPNMIEIYSGNRPKQIAINGATTSAVDPMIDQIWQQIESWGVPGPNGFWKPQLKVTIAPGGQQRFLQLKGLLFRSGLAIEESRK